MAPFDGSSPEAQALVAPKVETKLKTKEDLFLEEYSKDPVEFLKLVQPDLKLFSAQMKLMEETKKSMYEMMYVPLKMQQPAKPKPVTWSSAPEPMPLGKPEEQAEVQARIEALRLPRSTTQEIYYGAIMLLKDPRKWLKGAVSNSAGQVCYMGALEVITNSRCSLRNFLADCNSRLAEAANRRYRHGSWRAGHHFNDDVSTTHAMLLHCMCDVYEDMQRRHRQ